MRFKNINEVDEPEFQDIMTTEIKYFEDFEKEKDAKKFCEDREVTYLPLKGNNLLVREFKNGHFGEIELQESQKIKPTKKIFDKDVIELFDKSRVLFVFSKDKLKGIIHYSDYNREPVYIYLYSQILNFEKSLRGLLIIKGLKNEDMINYFEEKARDGDSNFRHKFDYINRNRESLKSFSEFQLFYLSDLIFLLDDRLKVSINQKVKDLRNDVMHSKDFVEHKDYQELPSLYRFSSFTEFFELVLTFYKEKARGIKDV